MSLKSGDRIYCHISYCPFEKGKTYIVFHVSDSFILLNDGHYLQTTHNEILDKYFTNIKEIRKNKLDKLNNYGI